MGFEVTVLNMLIGVAWVAAVARRATTPRRSSRSTLDGLARIAGPR